jgi:choline dehydrogenase-like flavoprotein
MSKLPDPIKIGLAKGWKIIDGSRLTADLKLDADVVIVGSGAGGGTAAELLSKAGLKIIVVEEGPLKSSSDFRMMERDAYPQLYQESAGRQSRDKAITIMQGRCVGGSTTVNWTSSFRTPPRTLAYWQSAYGLSDYSVETMAPWFAHMEHRLNIDAWPVAPNENNDILRRGCDRLGIPTAAIRRNVNGCWNLGYCGVGCPTNAKQSMLVTTIPAALSIGAILLHRARVERLVHSKNGITELSASGLNVDGVYPGPYKVRISAKHYILAGGAINTPALMLRSRLPDPHLTIGRRTFLHPTNVSAALMPERVDGYSGAPQSIYSDHFLDATPLDGPIGFKLEAPPVHPILASITLQGYGEAHHMWMSRLPYLQVLIALFRDGFHAQSNGGRVHLRPDGSPLLDYPISDYMWEGMRRSFLAMAEIQFAAGAKIVMPLHEEGRPLRNWRDAKKSIAALPMKPLRTKVVSAHVMGGCAMGADPRTSVVSGDGSHHQIENLSIFDGSVFPTSLGANPQLSIYGMVARNATRLAERLTGKPAPPINRPQPG